MLIERRVYTFRPGTLEEFVAAQDMLGFDPVKRPTMGRVISYFIDKNGPLNQIVHYWRFDDFDDWMARLHRKDASREPYFQRVRPLMLEQENQFLLPAPVAALTPIWGNGNDWLPGSAPIADLAAYPDLMVEETRFNLFPGMLPRMWDMLRLESSQPGSPLCHGLIGCFYTLVGRQHEIVMLRWHQSPLIRQEMIEQGSVDAGWQAFQGRVAPLIAATRSSVMTLPSRAPMAPLFLYPDISPSP